MLVYESHCQAKNHIPTKKGREREKKREIIIKRGMEVERQEKGIVD